VRFVEHLGDIFSLSIGAFRSITKRPFEIDSTMYQIDSLGVRSLGIVAVTSIFIGMVMTIQFAFGLQRFGGVEYIPRVIVLSFLRELGPTLTAIIVGGRIGSDICCRGSGGVCRGRVYHGDFANAPVTSHDAECQRAQNQHGQKIDAAKLGTQCLKTLHMILLFVTRLVSENKRAIALKLPSNAVKRW